MAEIEIRQATMEDIPEILRKRRGMYEDMDYRDAEALAQMIAATGVYLSKALADGSFRGWLASEERRVVGGGAMVITPWPSHPYDGQCRRATILNVYTYPEFRRRGIARQLMQTMIAWCREEGFAIIFLHATATDGRCTNPWDLSRVTR